MVPNLSKGRGIKGTALYVLHDERTLEDRALGAELTPDQQSAHRVGMTATRNLSTDDPDLAWRLMCATAKNRDALKAAAGIHKGGKQAKYEVAHLSLSWEHGTQPDRAEMLKAAEGALTALGWEKAQALIVEHRDHDHAHCHIVVNLVDPETGKAMPNIKDDYEKVLKPWAHQYDLDNGKIVCPNRAASIDAETQRQQQPDQQAKAKPERKKWLSRAEWEAQRAAANDAGTPPPSQDRAAQQKARVDRYRDAAAGVRDQFRPEWATLYKEQRQQAQALAKEQRATLAALKRAAEYRHQPKTDFERSAAKGLGSARKNGLIDFYNTNTALIWEGIPADQRPQSVAAILNKPALQRAIDAAHEKQRAELAAAQTVAKKELQARHDAARIDVQRVAWKQPGKAAPAEERRRHEKPAADPMPEKPARDCGAARRDPRADELARYRAEAQAEAVKMAQLREQRTRQRMRGRGGPEREPGQD